MATREKFSIFWLNPMQDTGRDWRRPDCARLKDVQFEYIFLWVQAGVYFITNWMMTYLENYRHLKRNELREKIRMQIEIRQANRRKSSK